MRTPTRTAIVVAIIAATVAGSPVALVAGSSPQQRLARAAVRPTPIADSMWSLSGAELERQAQTQRTPKRSRCPLILTLAGVGGPLIGGAIGAATGAKGGAAKPAIAGALLAMALGIAICLH